eukprot:Amastigsp_a349289_26.p1 type:complete len:232 gc:universal Amastigsp_a349289_26:150-845(+)
MASTPRASGKVAKFVQQLYDICSDERNNEIIRFGRDGSSFVVLDVRALEDAVFPHVFKHRNFASFHRQLLTHEFVKIGSYNEYMYRHANFKRGRPDLLPLIRRVAVKSKPHAGDAEADGDDPDAAAGERDQDHDSKVIAAIEARFEQLEDDMRALKAENAKLRNIVAGEERHKGFTSRGLFEQALCVARIPLDLVPAGARRRAKLEASEDGRRRPRSRARGDEPGAVEGDA